MSEDTRSTIEVKDTGWKSPDQAALDTAVKETRAQKKVRLSRVLDRGGTIDRLKVENLPPHLHGEWVPNDAKEILDKENLGFVVDREFAHKRKLHATAEGKAVIGDCVYMTIPMEDKLIIDEIRNEQYQKLNHKSGPQKEEKDFASQTSTLGEIPVISEGSVSEARKSELEAALLQQSQKV